MHILFAIGITSQSDGIMKSLRMTVVTQTLKISSKGGDLKLSMPDNSDNLFIA